MAVDSTLLMREVDNIVQQGEGISHYRLECRIQAGGEWVTPTRLDLYSLERDYETGFGDVLVLELLLGLGTYAYRIVPNRDTLLVDITSIPLREASDTDRSDLPRRTRRYRAILMDQDNPGLLGRSPMASSEGDLNLAAPKKVQLQLVDEGLYQARLTSVGRIYRNSTPMNALKSLLTETMALVDAKDQQQIFGVTEAPGYHTEKRDHVIIPHGTPLVLVPELLQNEEGGLYATGMGCYLQNGQWYIYPTYDIERFHQTPRGLTILSVPPNRYYGAERTYRQTANQVVLVGAGDMHSEDEGLSQQLNEGNAARFTDARKLMVFGESGNNKTRLDRSRNVFEVEGPELQSGLTHARWASQRATANPMPAYSRMARRNGRYVTVQWLHGDASLLYPGMPVKFMTASDDRLLTLYGVLLGVHEQRIPGEGGVAVGRYPSSITLKVFLSRTEGM